MITSLTNYLSSGVERSLMTIDGLVGAAFSFAFGDVAPLILWLAIFVTANMVTGILAAIRSNSLSGKKLFYGTIRKVVMFCIIALAHGPESIFSKITVINKHPLNRIVFDRFFFK